MTKKEEVGTSLESLHHVAVWVRDVESALEWYTRTFRCEVEYRDPTWAMLRFSNVRLALMAPGHHPPHLGFLRENPETFGPTKPHRDGTRSVYVEDPSGNSIEFLALDSLE